MVKLAVQQASENLLSLPPLHWDHRHMFLCSAFYEGAGIEFRSSCLHYKHVTDLEKTDSEHLDPDECYLKKKDCHERVFKKK